MVSLQAGPQGFGHLSCPCITWSGGSKTGSWVQPFWPSADLSCGLLVIGSWASSPRTAAAKTSHLGVFCLRGCAWSSRCLEPDSCPGVSEVQMRWSEWLRPSSLKIEDESLTFLLQASFVCSKFCEIPTWQLCIWLMNALSTGRVGLAGVQVTLSHSQSGWGAAGGVHETPSTLERWAVASDNRCFLPKAPYRILQLIIWTFGTRMCLMYLIGCVCDGVIGDMVQWGGGGVGKVVCML